MSAMSAGRDSRKRKASEARTDSRLLRKRQRPDQSSDLACKEAVNPDIGHMDASMLADLFGRQTKRFESKLSVVELEDRRVPGESVEATLESLKNGSDRRSALGHDLLERTANHSNIVSAFIDTTSWDGHRNLAALPAFLQEATKRTQKQLSDASTDKGSPHTLIITASGIRAADVTRAVRVYQSKNIQVIKLFAKHIKLKEAIESTRTTRTNIGVGTSQRVYDLIEQDALSISQLDHIIIDASNVNEKQRGILDMPETESALARLLAHEKIKKRMADGQVKIVVY